MRKGTLGDLAKRRPAHPALGAAHRRSPRVSGLRQLVVQPPRLALLRTLARDVATTSAEGGVPGACQAAETLIAFLGRNRFWGVTLRKNRGNE